MNSMKDFLYVEKYRPNKIDDIILPPSIKNTLKTYLVQGDFQNLMFHGSAGSGKTTAAKALCKELEFDFLFINGSNEGRQIDTLRTRIHDFASSLSMDGNKKCVIIDEFDNSGKDFQLALRASIEMFSDTCRFIFTCNNLAKVETPILSRCAVIEFTYNKEEKAKATKDIFMRIKNILDIEKIEYDKLVVGEIIKKLFPDFRAVLNTIQYNIVDNKIPNDIISKIREDEISTLVGLIKDKDFKNVRIWIAENIDKDYSLIIKQLYSNLYPLVDPQFIINIFLILNDFQKWAPTVADLELHWAATLGELMTTIQFKQ